MASRNRLTTEQIVTIGRYMWEHRTAFAGMTKTQAHEATVNATGLTVCRATWEKLLKEMQIQCATGLSSVESALTILRQELGIAPVVTQ